MDLERNKIKKSKLNVTELKNGSENAMIKAIYCNRCI